MSAHRSRPLAGMLLCLALATVSCSRDGAARGTDEPAPQPREEPIAMADNQPDPPPPPPQGEAQSVGALSDSGTSFACDLYREVAATSEDNLIFSPFSVHMALGMVYAGAAGATRDAMAGTLHVPADGPLYESYEALTAELPLQDPGYEPPEGEEGRPALLVANGVWAQDDFSFRQEYLDLVQGAYDAELRTADFEADPEAAAEDINGWVSDKTQEKISQIADPQAFNQIVMVLVNAIYFKGAWADQFSEAGTEDAPFHLATGDTVDVPTMQGRMDGLYAEGDGWTAIALPYERWDLRMIIVLPDDELGAMEPMVTGENVAAVLEELESRELRVWLPKFKFETTLPLTDTLKAMGMEVAFDPSRADLTGIAEQGGLFISSVLHKAMIDVNEHGTEAAAATMIAVGATAAEPEPPAEVHVDRPFLFMIHDRETDSVLFMGRVMDPREG